MTAFSAALDAIFADPNMAVDATWRDSLGGAGTPCRIVLTRPDVMGGYGDAQIVSDVLRFDVRVVDWQTPRPGDTITFSGETFVLQGEPRRDRMRLVWQCEGVPVE